jgi:copper chaperone
MEKIFKIPSVSCGHCLKTIERELGFVDGAEYVEGNVEAKTVRVELRDEAALETARSLLAEIGFTPVD